MDATTPQRVLVLYNSDLDADLRAESPDQMSEVEQSARHVHEALLEAGYDAELLGAQGSDLDEVFQKLRDDPPSLVFNLCESLSGNTVHEPVVPGLLDVLGIPYTGPGPVTLALCLDKRRTKQVLTASGLPTPGHVVVGDLIELEAVRNDGVLCQIDYPCILKLAREDASIGLGAENVVWDEDALSARARELITQYRQPVIAERFIEGREANVTVLEDADGRLSTLPLHEIDFRDMPEGRPRIVSFDAKWTEGHVDDLGTRPVPMVDISPALERSIVDTAEATFVALGLCDFGRVDMRIDEGGQPWVIDVNPNCDLSFGAGVARAARAAGLAYHALLRHICEAALARHRRRESRFVLAPVAARRTVEARRAKRRHASPSCRSPAPRRRVGRQARQGIGRPEDD